MTTTAKATKGKAKQTGNSLGRVYGEVEALLRGYVPPFKIGEFAVRGKESIQLVTPKLIAIPGAYGGKPHHHQFAAAILQKGYVGFYLMGVSSNSAVKKKLSPALVKTLEGKSCFHLKTLDEQMKKELVVALDACAEVYKVRGWV